MKHRLAVAALPTAALALGLATAACGGLFATRSEGERLWREHCAECHGLDAAGNTPRYMGRPYADLTDDAWQHGGDDSSIELITREGIFGEMPGYDEDEISREEMRQIIGHLRVLRGEQDPEPVE